MFKVIVEFCDLQDNGYKYSIGEEYPHAGYSPSKERINELASNSNLLKKPIIEEVIIAKEKKSEAKPEVKEKKAKESHKKEEAK